MIINILDKIPHMFHDMTNDASIMVGYQHGGVKYVGDFLSGALVFRVVDKSFPYNIFNNILVKGKSDNIYVGLSSHKENISAGPNMTMHGYLRKREHSC